jgi:fatty acid desaturase
VSGADLREARRSWRARVEGRQVLAQCLGLGGVLVLLGHGPVILGYVIPVLVAGLLCGVRDFRDHAREPFETTSDHDTGLVGALFLAPHSVGWHFVHHRHPEVAHENLARLAAWYRSC